MSQTACPDRRAPVLDARDAAPPILAFPVVAERLYRHGAIAGQRQDVVARARLQYQNRRCPNCRRITVEPIELDDALLDRNCHPIPGTATVVGFLCHSCRHEWLPPRLSVVLADD